MNSIQARDAVMSGLAQAQRILARVQSDWTKAEDEAALRMMINKLDPRIKKELKRLAPAAYKKAIGGK